MMRTLRASQAVVGCLLVAGAGCGEPATPSVEAAATEVTVLVPYARDTRFTADADDWSLDYYTACLSEDTKSVETDGALGRAGDVELEDGVTAVFRGPIELIPGPCTIQFRLRDSDGEVIFTASEAYDIEPRPPPELYVVMEDPGCPQSPLSDASAVRKYFCGPAGGLIVSAETPTAAANIESVHYLLTRTLDFLLETRDGPQVETYEGALDPAGSSTVDLGSGPMETNVWESIVGEVAGGAPYTLDLTALDADGAAVCTAQTTVEVVPTGIAQAHVVMRCAAP